MPETPKTKFYFKERRDKLKLSQEQVAERAKVSQETVSRLERGGFEPKAKTLRAMAKALECKVPELYRHPAWPPADIHVLFESLTEAERAMAVRMIGALKGDKSA